MPVLSTIKMTARQFLRLGEDPPGVRLELVDGGVAVSPSPRLPHSNVDKQLTIIVGAYIKMHDLGLLGGDVDTVLSEVDVRRPDLFYFEKSRAQHLDPSDAIRETPDLCVEIISPSSGVIDREDKFEQYASAGVPHYWLIDPEEKTIEAFVLRDGSYQLAAEGHDKDVVHLPPFPDLAIPLGDLWLPSRP